MTVCLQQSGVSFILSIGWTCLGLCIIGWRRNIGIICPWSSIRVGGSWLNIRIGGSRLSIGIVSSLRHSRWCTSQTSSNIICPALTQNAESLLLSPLKKRLSSSYLQDSQSLSRIGISTSLRLFFESKGRDVISSTFSPLDLLNTRTRYAKGFISNVDATNPT